jgi:hypothetical protein
MPQAFFLSFQLHIPTFRNPMSMLSPSGLLAKVDYTALYTRRLLSLLQLQLAFSTEPIVIGGIAFGWVSLFRMSPAAASFERHGTTASSPFFENFWCNNAIRSSSRQMRRLVASKKTPSCNRTSRSPRTPLSCTERSGRLKKSSATAFTWASNEQNASNRAACKLGASAEVPCASFARSKNRFASFKRLEANWSISSTP